MQLQRLLILGFACALTACTNELLAGNGGDRDTGAGDNDGTAGDLKPMVYGESAVDPDGFAGVVTGPCEPGQRILRDGVVNARDLGGVSLHDGATVPCGALYRGAAITFLSEQGCAEFTALGIRTVIDLRVPDEHLSNPYAACVANRTRIIHAPMPIPTHVSPAEYLTDLNAIDSVAAAFEALGDESAYPIYINCYYGRDRTGILATVVLLALGATRDPIMAEYELTDEAGLTTYPNNMEAVLDEIEARGGIETYLASAGISSEQIATLRAQAMIHW